MSVFVSSSAMPGCLSNSLVHTQTAGLALEPMHAIQVIPMSQGLLAPSGSPPCVSVMPTATWADVQSSAPVMMAAGGAHMTSFHLDQMVAASVPHMTAFGQQQQPSGTSIFFAGVTPIAAPESLLSVFAQFGRVMDLNLFRPYKGCRTSKGCGLVVFSQHSEAAAALETLHGRFVWPGARSPMVIEWCDPSKQHKRKRAQPLAPALLQQVITFPQQALPYMMPHMPAPSAALGWGFMPNGNAGRLMMHGY